MYIKEVNPLNEKIHTVLTGLHKLCLPSDELPDFKKGYWWIVYSDALRTKPVAFCGMSHVISWETTGYLCRAGVLVEYRGQGIQKKMINARIRKAKRLGLRFVISATRSYNHHSSNNLIKTGFFTYNPQKHWLEDGIYWMKVL